MMKFQEGGFDGFSFDYMTPQERQEHAKRGPVFKPEEREFVERNFPAEVREHVSSLTFSDNQNLPTALLDSGDVVQFIYDSKLRIKKIRVLPTANNAALVVQTIMAALLLESGGELSAIDPANIGFGETERFQRTYKGEWENAYRRHVNDRNRAAAEPSVSNLRELSPRQAPQKTVAEYHAA